jgi:hypothetical protein
MNTPNDDKAFADKSKDLFDDSVERLDAATLSRLNQGRQAALAEIAGAKTARPWVRWMPATGMAAAAVIAVVVLRGPGTTGTETLYEIDGQVADFEILIGDDEFEMLEELEFYSWLDNAENDPGDNVG